MTEVIHMQPDDPRVGRYTDGNIQWPSVDCDGKPFDKKAASTRSFMDTASQPCFVVIPPDRDHEHLVFEVVVPFQPTVDVAVEAAAPTDGKKKKSEG